VGREVSLNVTFLAPYRRQQRAHADIVPDVPGGGKTAHRPWAPAGAIVRLRPCRRM